MKPFLPEPNRTNALVAPRRGAWVETDDAGGELMVLCPGRTPQGCVG